MEHFHLSLVKPSTNTTFQTAFYSWDQVETANRYFDAIYHAFTGKYMPKNEWDELTAPDWEIVVYEFADDLSLTMFRCEEGKCLRSLKAILN